MSMSGLLVAALLTQAAPPQQEPAVPYTCSVPVEIEGLHGAMWRHFYPSLPDDFYVIQLQNPEVPDGPFVLWSVDNRPPAPPRVYGHQTGRPRVDAFRLGPDSISFGQIEHGGVPGGRIWVRLFGDGTYAGVFLRQNARRTREAYRRGERSLWVGLMRIHAPDIFARLANAREWRAVLVTEAGRELGSKTVTVPRPDQAQAAFERARTELLRRRDAFIAGNASPSGPRAACEIIEEGL